MLAGASGHFGSGEAKEIGESVVDEEPLTVDGEDCHTDGGVFEEGTKAFFVLAPRVVGMFGHRGLASW